MPRARPQLSITLPRNFTFHYTEGEEPKTPERELSAPPVPKSPRAYRIKRRARPLIPTGTFASQDAPNARDVPIPTIETPTSVETVRPLPQQPMTEPAHGFLAPAPLRNIAADPRTPTISKSVLAKTWSASSNSSIGESITRPMSACSLLSDSSEESDFSAESYQSVGGSCTSPESDAADPFGTRSIRKPKLRTRPRLEAALFTPSLKQIKIRWTPEMDQHLWKTYLVYLQDPTVTPFKLLPGVAPPLGVCHRVAREARRSWKGARTVSKSPAPSSPLAQHIGRRLVGVGGTPDTVVGKASDTAPAAQITAKSSVWPKSGSSTRKRLRELCKRKPTIAPHYQRLMSRSPSPFSSSSPRPHSRSSRMSSPFNSQNSSLAFNTRDVRLSLTTSTAATMQPDGPLAQLSQRTPIITHSDTDRFNEPPILQASPAAIPSDIDNPPEDTSTTGLLGSPFNGFHTWGPSRSKQQLCSATPRTQSSDVSMVGPSLRSPVRLHDTFPYPGVSKRRAQHQLEDELSPGGSDIRRELLENLFGAPTEARSRRVRNRGFSHGDLTNEARLASLFSPPSADETMNTPTGPAPSTQSNATLSPPSEPINRLGSPFAGIGRRPTRRSPGHMTSASLSAYDPSSFASIEQRLNQDGGTADLARFLRGHREALRTPS